MALLKDHDLLVEFFTYVAGVLGDPTATIEGQDLEEAITRYVRTVVNKLKPEEEEIVPPSLVNLLFSVCPATCLFA